MTIHSPITAEKTERTSPADGHRWRSELLDEFALFEGAVISKCREHGLPVAAKATLAQRLNALKKINLHHADGAQTRLDECLALLAVRNDLVHAKLHLILLSADIGGPTFLFRNVNQDVADGTSVCRMVNEAGFKFLQVSIKQCREHIKQLRVPTPNGDA